MPREEASLVPVIVGAALLGLAAGYWLGRRD
jgi:LPXTG-motif cell wall-anchored protein